MQVSVWAGWLSLHFSFQALFFYLSVWEGNYQPFVFLSVHSLTLKMLNEHSYAMIGLYL